MVAGQSEELACPILCSQLFIEPLLVRSQVYTVPVPVGPADAVARAESLLFPPGLGQCLGAVTCYYSCRPCDLAQEGLVEYLLI